MSPPSRRVCHLLRRLVESLPPVSGPWQPSGSEGDAFANFHDFTDEEIEQVRQVVLSSGGDPYTAIKEVEQVVMLQSSSDLDDEESDADDSFAVPGPKILIYPMKEPIIEFHLDRVTEEAQRVD
jgi:hypothetical protein